jgi:hypothetical protein
MPARDFEAAFIVAQFDSMRVVPILRGTLGASQR